MPYVRNAAPAALPQLHLQLFGSFQLSRENQPLALRTHKTQALLAYLALHPESHSREKLAALFWGDSPDKQARISLRVCLNALRKSPGQEIISADSETVQISREIPIWIDAREFEFYANPQKRPAQDLSELDALKTAVALYRGDLLADFHDDWILPERVYFRQLYLELLLKLVHHARAASEYEQAIEFADKLLAADPANESAYQHLMFCYVAIGNRTLALQKYEECKSKLWDELGVEPSLETNSLREWIREADTGWKSYAPRLTNLPIPLSSFVGRRQELQELRDHLRQRRLITLTGAGGSGKTRLAIQLGTDLIDSYRDGVWWVELGAFSDSALVVQQVVKALGVQEVPNQSLDEPLTNYLFSRQVLLVLDNCEHLIDACAQLVSMLLNRCPFLTILTTSREVLGVTGELTWIVPPLSLPHNQSFPSIERLGEYEAIRLFIERSTSVKPDFALTEQNAVDITRICQRLDGLPLAIELAAARTKLLSIQDLATRLNDRFVFLTAGSRAVLPRQQTLRATLDWSYDLLSETSRALLCRLSVFRGSFSLEAVETICSDVQLPSPAVFDRLASLVDKSLVLVEGQDEHARYRLLETIREYAREKLADSNHLEHYRSRHLDYFVELVEQAESDWCGRRRLQWFKRLEAEYDNLTASLESSLNLPNGLERGTRLGAVLGQFWAWRTHKAEERYWLETLLTAGYKRGIGSPLHRARMTFAAGILAYELGDDLVAQQFFEESAALCRESNDRRGLGLALYWLGFALERLGRGDAGHASQDESVAVLSESEDKWALAYVLGHRGATRAYHNGAKALEDIRLSLSLFDELGDQWTVEIPLGGLARLKLLAGEYAEARALQERSIQAARELDNQFGVAMRTASLAAMWRAEGNYREAEAAYARSLAGWRRLGNQQFIIFTLTNLAATAIQLGNLEKGLALLVERLEWEVGRKQASDWAMFSVCQALFTTAAVLVARDQPALAARLLGAAERGMQQIDTRDSWIGERAEYERTIAAARAHLNEAAFEAGWAEGRTLTLPQAVEYALESIKAQGAI